MDTLTNENLNKVDWSAGDRQRFLASIAHKKTSMRKQCAAPYGALDGGWMTDVSINDARSVKAQLAGRGDYRSAWWNFRDWLYRFTHPGSDLHMSMYQFHKFHGNLTISRLKVQFLFRKVRQDIFQKGLAAALKSLPEQAKNLE